MKDLKVVKHDLNRDIQNILSVLQFLNTEVEIKDSEIQGMLSNAISKESEIIKNLEKLSVQ
jgi:hypothetical protein